MHKTFLSIFFVACSLFNFEAVHAKRFKPVKQQFYSRVDSKVVHFGFTVGLNYLDYGIQNSDYNNKQSYRAEQVKFNPGLTLSLISEWNINEDFGLRFCPGIIWGKRRITYVNVKENFTNEVVLNSLYADFPLYIKYKSKRIVNYRPYLIGGISFKYDLLPHDELDPSRNELLKTEAHDLAIEIGAGIDFYFSYFKVSTELKLSVGLRDIAVHILDEDYPETHEYTDAISHMKSKIVTLSFHFE